MRYTEKQFIMLLKYLIENYENNESSISHVVKEIELGIKLYKEDNL